MPANPSGYFNSSPEVIRLVVLMYVRFPLSARNVEELLSEREIDFARNFLSFCSNLRLRQLHLRLGQETH
jgi:transposase-like protein